MRALASLFISTLVVACGSGLAPGKGEPRSTSAVSDLTRQQIIDACSPPFTGPTGTGGLLSSTSCGVPVPTSGSDQDPQRWWDFAGCIADHPDRFSDACKSHFLATCGNGDLCICDVGQTLEDDGSCSGACTPKTYTQACHDPGLECGSVSDGCGGTLDCGHCTAPEVCGSDNMCGAACVPKTYTEACHNPGLECGPVSDGCGGTLDCGHCTAPEVCGSDNMCGAACVPKTYTEACHDPGLECGNVSDGCGGTLNCGHCTAPETCGGGGHANICGVGAGDLTRQQIIDACSPPFTGLNGTGGLLSSESCGVPVPTSGADQNPQHWWFFAGCIADHPDRFSSACKSHFNATCGANGDLCICNPGQVLDDYGHCI